MQYKYDNVRCGHHGRHLGFEMLIFDNDREWPEGVLKHFQHLVTQRGVESRYYGPYNFMLSYVTGFSEDYEVAPQTSVVGLGDDRVDFVVWYVVRDAARRVLLIVEVKDDSQAATPSTRDRADVQMRARFRDLSSAETLNPRVYGISLLGTRMTVYTLDTVSGAMDPEAPQRGNRSHMLPRDYMADWWDKDILSQSGFDAMKRIMADVRAMSEHT